MTKEEFYSSLLINHTNLPIYSESQFKGYSDRIRKDGKTPRVYTTDEDITPLIDGLDKFEPTIRFVVSKDNKVFLGENGPVQRSTPGHEEMSNSLCLAAGTLTFDSSLTTIISISHESGFFKPQISCLIWILKYLYSDSSVFTIGEKLSISYFDEQINNWQELALDSDELKSFLDNITPLAANFEEKATDDTTAVFFESAAAEEPHSSSRPSTPTTPPILDLSFFSSAVDVKKRRYDDRDDRDYEFPAWKQKK